MKTLTALAFTLLASMAYGKCQDRYYYYEAKPLPAKVKNWQIYEDNNIQFSKEIKDFLSMTAACSPALDGEAYHFTAYFNYIVEPNLWKKLSNPLYKNMAIRLPNGVYAQGANASTMDVVEFNQQNRKSFTQYRAELSYAGKTSVIYVYLVRKGIDQMYTPLLNVSFSKNYQRDGYYFTEYKP
ncbi:hypothetical protein ABEH28_13460 [Pseudomonas sp. Ps21-P2]|uniref:hypothetical protein n=1 Tax=Pseudomonas sp. Ps21-P2 TaxID=3080331 RepID=UPI00320A055B